MEGPSLDMNSVLPGRLQRSTLFAQKTQTQKFAEEAERLRKLSPVIRPVAGPWSPGVLLGGMKSLPQESENPTIWVPKRQLQLLVETAGSANPGAVEKRFSRDSGIGLAGTDAASSRKPGLEAGDPIPAPWMAQVQFQARGSEPRGTDDCSDGFKVPSYPARKENKAERYKELRVTGLAVLQHLELLMKHTDALIRGAEQSSVSESMTVHAVHSRQVMESGNAEAADALAKSAVEQLETYRRVLRATVPGLSSLEPRDSANGETTPVERPLPAKHPLTASPRQQQQTAVTRDEKDTSLTLACGGSFVPVLSPANSGESGGGSICEDDAAQAKAAAGQVSERVLTERIAAVAAAAATQSQPSDRGGGERTLSDRLAVDGRDASEMEMFWRQALDAKLSPLDRQFVNSFVFPSPQGQFPFMSPTVVDEVLRELQAKDEQQRAQALAFPQGFQASPQACAQPPIAAAAPAPVSQPGEAVHLVNAVHSGIPNSQVNKVNQASLVKEPNAVSVAGPSLVAAPVSVATGTATLLSGSDVAPNSGSAPMTSCPPHPLAARSQSESAQHPLAALRLTNQHLPATQQPALQTSANLEAPCSVLGRMEPPGQRLADRHAAEQPQNCQDMHPPSAAARQVSTSQGFPGQSGQDVLSSLKMPSVDTPSFDKASTLSSNRASLIPSSQSQALVLASSHTLTTSGEHREPGSPSANGEAVEGREVELERGASRSLETERKRRSGSPDLSRMLGAAVKRHRMKHLEEEVPGDTWQWRKYGQKVIKDTSLYRSYYRCGCRKGPMCTAKRHVDRYLADNTVASVVYEGEHCHPQPPPKRRTTIVIRNQPDSHPAP